jgi:hypothetical protein
MVDQGAGAVEEIYPHARKGMSVEGKERKKKNRPKSNEVVSIHDVRTIDAEGSEEQGSGKKRGKTADL